jgi:hypothetical protein
VLGLEVHRVWFLLTPLVGVGLIYAGITRSCLLARWLDRLPWNRSDGGPQAA